MLLLAVFLAGIATAHGQPEPTLALLRSGARPLVVGGVSEFTPFNVVGPDGQLTGMDREIVRAAAKRLGIKQVEFKTMAFSKLGQSLLDGKIDLIANNYWPTPDRERLYAFTMPYKVGRLATLSALALIGLRPPPGSLHPCGSSPQRSRSSVRSPVLWF